MLGDGGSDLIDGDIWDLEFISVRVQQCTMTGWLQISPNNILVQSLRAH